jgi:uncharacterized protein (TIGR03083 family)
MASEDQALVDKMEAVWRSIDELCSDLSEEQWKTPTDCPGWSVQDNLSHLAGNEGVIFLGRAAPDHAVQGDTSHLKNDIGKMNEVGVDYRRSWPGSKVLDEFGEVTAERLQALRSWGPDDFAKDARTPLGPGTQADFLAIRIFDAWVHEQDMRRALGKPGDLEGPVAEHALGRIRPAMGFVVGKKVAPPAGTTVVFDITGPVGATWALKVDGRANEVDPPANPTVKLTMDLSMFNCLGCGRWSADRAAPHVKIEGDEALGRAILDQMNFMI